MAAAFGTEAHADSVGPVATLACNKPASTAAGDFLVATLNSGSGATAFTAPAGWAASSLGTWTDSLDSAGAVFTLTAGGSEPASYTFSWTTAGQISISIVRITGSNGTIRSIRRDAKGSTAASFTSTALSGTQSGDLIVACGINGDDSGTTGSTITPPGSPWTTINNFVAATSWKYQANSWLAGPQSTNTATFTSNSSKAVWNIITYAVEPAAGTSVALTTPNLVLAAPLVTPTAGATVALTTPSLVLAAPAVTPAVPPIPFPQGPLGLEADVYLGTWTTATTYVYQRTPVQITRGRPNEGAQISPCQATMTVSNRDGRWTIRNPAGAWYGQLVQNTPLRLSVPSSLAGIDCYLRLETDRASYASCPDSTGLQITSGTLSVRADCLITDWSYFNVLAAKRGTTATAWAFYTDTTGALQFWHYDGSAAHVSVSTLPVPYFGARIALRADYNISAQTITFYTAPTMAGSWTQLGSVLTTPATAQASGSGQAVTIGDDLETVTTPQGTYGSIYEAQVLSSGTLEADPVFTSQTPLATSFADTQGNTWTLAGTAELSGRLYRFHGELSSLPRAADPSATDVYSAATATGPTSRLQQAQTPADSAMKRAYVRLPAAQNLSAYWPAEDASSATQIGQATGKHPMTSAGLTMASSTVFAASAAIPVMNGATASGTVDPGSVSWTDNVVRFLLAVPAADDTNGAVVAQVTTQGTIATAQIVYGTGGSLALHCFNSAGATVAGANIGPLAFGLTVLAECRVSLEILGSGATGLWVVTPDTAYYEGGSGTFSGTVGGVTGVSFGGGLVSSAMGHFSVQGVFDSLEDLGPALGGWYGEAAATRYSRLCGEEGIPCRIIGAPATTQPMGVQTQQTIAALLQEIETTDQGMQFEPRQVLGLGYVTRGALTHPAVMASADYSLAQIAAAFSPSSDTQLLLNDVTMTAADGSTARQVLATGSLSVQSPPSGAGRFDTQVTVNPENDSQLNSLAGWFLSVRSFDDDRYPVIPFDMARTETPDTIPLLDIGSFLELVNTPQWVPPGPVKQLCAGFTETLGPFGIWTIGVNGIPETPYETAVVNDPVYGHLDTAGSTLTTGISSSAASMSVTTTLGPIWTTAAGDFPFDVRMTGEQITVTSITGASSPQTFTITRSVNGVAKSHLAGEAISLYHPMILAL